MQYFLQQYTDDTGKAHRAVGAVTLASVDGSDFEVASQELDNDWLPESIRSLAFTDIDPPCSLAFAPRQIELKLPGGVLYRFPVPFPLMTPPLIDIHQDLTDSGISYRQIGETYPDYYLLQRIQS